MIYNKIYMEMLTFSEGLVPDDGSEFTMKISDDEYADFETWFDSGNFPNDAHIYPVIDAYTRRFAYCFINNKRFVLTTEKRFTKIR